MKLSISNPGMSVSKKFLIEDEQKMKAMHDLRISDEMNGDFLGEQFKGYIFKITGGSDKQGFAMMQGVLTPERVRLLLGEKHACYHVHRRQKRKATRKRKSIRGCITSAETALLNLIIVKKGDKDIPGLTDEASNIPNRMGPKRATKIRKLWNLEKSDDVRQYIIRRKVPSKKDPTKMRSITPSVQRLVTPKRNARKARQLRDIKASQQKSKEAREVYEKMIAAKREATRSKRLSKLSKKRDEKPAPKAASKKGAKKTTAAPKATAQAAKKPAAKSTKKTSKK